ncbi:L-rhamnose mutarotase [Sphingobium sp. Sx8-8]|uniref:L-rhamnose mutarotase n=1 Tax=Sphingobium sp. Sx8-8 TaxID=2933617 RepID=UPI001F580A8E|nr:L-rhamnose mutarotase [Sphingobium sp. Sx8-8]
MSETKSKRPRRIVRVMDLADDPAVWAEYDAAHRPGGVTQAVLDAQRRHGIIDMEIFRAGNRLVMLMQVDPLFDGDAMDAEKAADPAMAEWERRMGTLQRAPLADGTGWPEAALVFRQSDHP